jgi:hypothetical protein
VDLFTIILQLYYNHPILIYNHTTIILQLPSTYLQSYYNHITITQDPFTIILQSLSTHSQSYNNHIITTQYSFTTTYNSPIHYYNVVIKGCGIIHIAYRAAALQL